MTKPKVIIFDGLSLDGRLDGGGGDTQADMNLYYTLAARWNADVMLSGSETMVTAFAGQEEVPPSKASKELHPLAVPMLAIVDSRGRIHCWNHIKQQVFWKDAIALVSRATPKSYLEELEQKYDKQFRVVLQIMIDATGKTYPVRVVQSPDPSLDSLLMDYAAHVTFTPPQYKGKAVKAQYLWPVVFSNN